MSFQIKQTNGQYKAVITSLNSDRLVEQFDEIEKNLVNSNISKGLIFLDLTSNNGNEKNKYMEIYFDGKKLRDSTIRIAKPN
ncbi:MAG: type II toxin-antitoxin system RnlB family antitoxin [Silvanigrellaceae bacterium]|nr:type II toxin-antitoxin system RnlB family antitoxin [Silvanigrellaceae bacterium]